ncbi:MAG: hypothetical protein AABX93_03445 [Nanoarchaeota archaeon]
MSEYIVVYNLTSVLESGREISEFEVSIFRANTKDEATKKAHGEYLELTSKNHGGLSNIEFSLLFEAKLIEEGRLAKEVLEKLRT